MLMKLTPGVNFTNISLLTFLYKSALHSFFLITVCLRNFLMQKFVKKGARKMLMKLTTVFLIVIFLAGFLLSRLLLLGHVLCHYRGDVKQGRPRRYSQRLLVLQDSHHGRARCNHLRHPNLTSGSGTAMLPLSMVSTIQLISKELFLIKFGQLLQNHYAIQKRNM